MSSQDAKARLAAVEHAGVEWDQRAGIVPLRAQYEAAKRAEHRAAMRMARTKPTTAAGAGAMVDYARRDIRPIVALKTAASAFARMDAEAAS